MFRHRSLFFVFVFKHSILEVSAVFSCTKKVSRSISPVHTDVYDTPIKSVNLSGVAGQRFLHNVHVRVHANIIAITSAGTTSEVIVRIKRCA